MCFSDLQKNIELELPDLYICAMIIIELETVPITLPETDKEEQRRHLYESQWNVITDSQPSI